VARRVTAVTTRDRIGGVVFVLAVFAAQVRWMSRAATVLSVGLIIAYLLWVATPWKNDLAAVLLTAIDLSDRFVQLARERVTGAQVEKIDTRYLAFPGAIFDGVWASFSVLHIRANEIRKTLDGFKSVLRESGLFLAAVHRGPKTEWIRTTISGMERDTYLQEWLQTAIEAVVGEAGFEIIGSRPFERTGGRYALLSTLAHK
jgi:SAM-dependent methyltransferase